jgi:CheY-like chemotaxis protein
VARVLICEPDPEVRELLRRVVARLGHEPVLSSDKLEEVQAIVLEPAHHPSVEVAQAFRAFASDVPIVCASIAFPNGGTRRLEPVAFLVKPFFALPELEAALELALARAPA